jgi:2-methylcitrate dehydratase PrpD
VLHDRELWLDQFEPGRYEDPALKRFAKERIELAGNAQLTAEQAIVQAHLKDGATLRAHCTASKGTPENPLTRAEIEEKFRRAAKDRLPQAQAHRVLASIAKLEDLKSVRSLMDVLRAAA